MSIAKALVDSDSFADGKLGNKPVVDLRRADIIELLDDLQHKKGLGAQVNRIHAALKAALTFAVEREYLDANPAAAVKKQFKGEVPRERVLTDDELKAIWQVADALTEPSRGLVKMMILTGQRRDEVRCLPWAELDMEASLWTLPAARNKGKREHVVPLSDEAKAVLEALPKLGEEFVFTTGGKRPYAGTGKARSPTGPSTISAAPSPAALRHCVSPMTLSAGC